MSALSPQDQLSFLSSTNTLLDKSQHNAASLRGSATYFGVTGNADPDVVTQLLSAAIGAKSTQIFAEIGAVIRRLLEPAAASRAHYEFLYQTMGSVAAASRGKEQMTARLNVFISCVELLRILTQPVAMVSSSACFYSLPGGSKMRVNIPEPRPWPFHEGYTFMAWIKPERLGEGFSREATLFRIVGSTCVFECRLSGKLLMYKVSKKLPGTPKQGSSKTEERELEITELANAKLNYIAISHDLSPKSSHFCVVLTVVTCGDVGLCGKQGHRERRRLPHHFRV